jgi:hypothetical protein
MQEQQLIDNFLSSQRLRSYHKPGFAPIEVYRWNVALSEAVYPLLHIIEVALRNRLHDAIANVLGDQDWVLNRDKKILACFDDYWARKIDSHILLLKKKNKLDEGHLVAELSFGFWTALISGPFEYKNFLWPKLKAEVFPNSHGITTDRIRKRFDKIRNLRNRVFHYRSIWHWSDLIQQHDNIIEAVKWISPTLLELVQLDRFAEVYARGPNAKK